MTITEKINWSNKAAQKSAKKVSKMALKEAPAEQNSLEERSQSEAIVGEHYEGLYKFAYSLCKSADMAGDLTQETFLIWFRKGQSLRDKSKVKSWLFTTLYREYIQRNKKKERYSSLPVEEHNLKVEETCESAPRTDEKEILMKCLSELSELYRTPLVLHYIEGLAYKEIAQVLEAPMGTIMGRMARAKKHLKESFEAHVARGRQDSHVAFPCFAKVA